MTRQPIGIAVIGYGWMGRAHSHAYLRVGHHFPDLTLTPRLIAVADPEPDRRAEAQDRYGFTDAMANWHDLLNDDRIAAVSITAPNFLHRELGTAFAAAGKHLWIEKPVGVDADDARAVAAAVHDNSVQSTVGFNYRNAPAVEQARAEIAAGSIGTVTDLTVRLRSDYAAHPSGALSWRFERARGGAGVLGDLASHAIDLARFLVGDLAEVLADTAVVIDQRPRPSGAGSHFDVVAGGELGLVENQDFVSALLRFTNGARGILEASRVSVGDQNNYGFVVHGTRGQLAWDFRRMGELQYSTGSGYVDQPTSTIFVGPGDGEAGAFQPGAGISLGYDDLKVIECARFLRSITEQHPIGASIDDAVQSAIALQALEESAATRSWVSIVTPDSAAE